MNCNVAWYLQSGSCAPLWVNIVFFACAFIVSALWADLVVYRGKHVITFLFFVLSLLLLYACYSNNTKLLRTMERFLTRK